MSKRIELGDEVKDSISGFIGIASAVHVYLDGCVRISVQPKVRKDGKLPENQAFDEPRLVVLKKNSVKKGRDDVGGPDKFIDKGRM